MPKLTIDNLQPGTLDGDTLYETAEKVNANFDEIYTVFGDGTTLSQAYTALQGLNAGLIVSQGLNTYTSREIKSLTSSIQVTNGTGAQGDPTLDLSPTGVLPAGSAPTLQADQGFTVDVQGRITALSTPTLLPQVTAQANAASASAGTASTKASEAAASATTAANDVATIGTSLSQAATHATNAGNSATAAGTSATTATTQAGLATTNGQAQVTLATAQVALATTQAGLATTNGQAQVTLATAQVALAEDEKDDAVIAKNASVAAKDLAVIAKDASVVAKDASIDAKDLAVIAKTASETAKTASETAKTAAETASTAAAESLDSFDDRYLGPKSSAPTVDNDGNALITGTLYFNSSNNTMFVRTSGGSWANAGSAVNGTTNRTSTVATSGQVAFSIVYDVGFVDVYLNGIKLSAADFGATNGTQISLNVAASAGDQVDCIGYGAFAVANTYTVSAMNAILLGKAPLAGANFASGASAPKIGGATIKAIATSGAYSDLSGKPDLSVLAPINNPSFTGTAQVGGATILTSATAPASGGTANFVAQGNLTNGMAVGLRADGKVEPISGVDLGDGTSTASTFAVSNSAHRCFSTCYDSTNDKTIIVYVDDVNVKAAVCTVTDNALTFGTPVTIHSGGAALDTQTSVCHDPNVDRLLFVYSVASANVTYLKVGQLSGTGLNSITLGSSTNLTAKASTLTPITTVFQKERPGPADVNVIVVAFGKFSNNYLAISAITITGGSTNTAAFSTITDLTSASTADHDTAYFASDQRVVATYVKPSDTYNLQARPFAWYGSSWSLGTENAIDNGYWTESQVMFDAQGGDKRGFVFARESLNNGYSSCWTLNCNGNVSAGSPVVVNSGDNGTYLGADTNGKNQAVLFYLVGSTVKSVLVSRSGATITAATPASFQSFGGTHNVTIYDPDVKTFISVSRNPGDGILTAKTYAEAGSNNTSFIGISDAVTSSGATGAVTVFSGIKTGLSSLTPNKVYYVSATGVINDTATGAVAPVKIGRALSTSSLQITEAHT